MRKSGRTFRKVLLALAAVSEGQHIVYISNTPQHLEHARLLAEKCVSQNGHARIVTNKIHFKDDNAGCLEFLTELQHAHKELDGKYHGIKPHFVFDLS